MVRRTALIGFVAALLLGLAVAADDSETMTEQDVVQFHVRGMPEDEIIERILASQVEFDLSEEMLEELKIAGVADRILAAMKRRQRELAPEPPAGTAVVVLDDGSTLAISLNPGREPGAKPATVQVMNAMERDAAAALGIKGDGPVITQLGLLVFCRTPDHVPDHWRRNTVVGRDFNAPRHAMLEFLPGGESQPAAKWKNGLSKITRAKVYRESMADLEVLIFEVPEQIDIPLEPGMAHDLTLALTITVDGKTYIAAADHWDGVTLADGETQTVEAEFRGRRKDPLAARVEFLGAAAD